MPLDKVVIILDVIKQKNGTEKIEEQILQNVSWLTVSRMKLKLVENLSCKFRVMSYVQCLYLIRWNKQEMTLWK